MERSIYGDGIGLVQYIDHMGDDRRAAASARASFAKDIETRTLEEDEKLIHFLLRHGHNSPFEHSTISIRFTVPLFVRSQLIRHRTFSYNEMSRRYTSAGLEFWAPRELRAQAAKNLQCSSDETISDPDLLARFTEHNRASRNLYLDLVQSGVSRELARAVLPVSSYTTFWMTGNLRNWLTVFHIRLKPDVQPETLEAMRAAFEIVEQLFPLTIRVLQESGFLPVRE